MKNKETNQEPIIRFYREEIYSYKSKDMCTFERQNIQNLKRISVFLKFKNTMVYFYFKTHVNCMVGLKIFTNIAQVI